MRTLNLTKYISEVAAAIVEAKLKMTDVPAVVNLCCVLHQTYAEFAAHLIENWQKILSLKKDEKVVQSVATVHLSIIANNFIQLEAK
jgi:regulator of nonsense transcripts 2